MTRPAHRIRLFASRIVSTGTMERLVDPILGDIEIERRESVRAGRPWRARWIVAGGYVGLCRALALHGVHEFARGATSDSDGARAVRLSIAAFVVVTLAMMLPPLLATRGPLKADRGLIAITLVPQAIPLSLPLAVAVGIAVAWPKRAIRRVLLRRALIFGVVGMASALATMEWLVPAGNQAFREIVFRRLNAAGIPAESIHPPRGIGERSLSELATLASLFSRGAVWSADDFATVKEFSAADPAFETNQVVLALQFRLAVSFATAVLCLLAVAIACTIRGRTLGRTVFAVVAVCYAVSFHEFSEIARIVPPTVAAWLPTLGLAVTSVVLLRARPLTPSNP
jgi:hypothetical protein